MSTSPLADFEAAFAKIRLNTPFRDFLMEIASWQPLALYKRPEGISRYPQTDRLTNVVSPEAFREIRDSLIQKTELARSDRPFFEVFAELFRALPTPALLNGPESENSEYTDCGGHSKNAYLSIIANHGENILYSFSVKWADDVYGSVGVWEECDQVYASSGVTRSSKVFYSRYIDGSNNVWFSRNLIGCSECLFCEGLQNASYHINNTLYDKAEYFRKKAEILAKKSEFENWYVAMPKDSKDLSSVNSTGIFTAACENVENGGWVSNLKDARNALFTGGRTEKFRLYDTVTCGALGNMYATINGKFFAEYVYGSVVITGGAHVFYSYHLTECSYCIGCVGLTNRSYCIYNEQYTEAEWHVLAAKILGNMQKDGIFGKIFPGSTNPFYFNDTLAYLMDQSFTQVEAQKAGFLWREAAIKVDIPESSQVITTADLAKYELPDGKIDREVMKKTVQDSNGNFYRIVALEIDFIERHHLPLPKTHWLERIREGFKMR